MSLLGAAGFLWIASTYLDLKARYRLGTFEFLLNGRNILDDDDIVGIGTGEAGFVVPKGATWEVSVAKRF